MRQIAPFLPLLFLVLISCKKHKFDAVTQGEFTLTSVPSDKPDIFQKTFTKHVAVFGIDIFASHKVPNDKVFHAANVMAQYLDNDEDGIVDNAEVVAEMQSRHAFLFMFNKQRELGANKFNRKIPDGWEGQDLRGEETRQSGSGSDGFDATLEEVLHLITAKGYAQVYPHRFGESTGSSIALAMDIARGGHFEEIPDSYPAGAWYTYDDKTCEYGCMITEYNYWALTSILGAQDYSGRASELSDEWHLTTAAQVLNTDPTIYALLTDPIYKWPTILPDGSYRQ
jgi:hypothetical protein